MSKHRLPHVSAPDELVVGLFGGSVAMFLGADKAAWDAFEKGMEVYVRDHGFSKVTLLNLAMGCYMQLQTHNVFTYFFHDLDRVIFLDGYNEVNKLRETEPMRWPITYPWQGVWQPLVRRQFNARDLRAIGGIEFLSDLIEGLTRLSSRSVLGRSMFVHALWRIGADQFSHGINQKRLSLNESLVDSAKYEGFTASSLEESRSQIASYFALYERLSMWQAALARDAQVPYFHFIQPNKYVRGSKPLSEEEIRQYTTKGEAEFKRMTSLYQKLAEIVGPLKALGVNAHSLTDVFVATEETVYSDEHCHLNTRGNRILMERILSIILKSFGNRADGPGLKKNNWNF